MPRRRHRLARIAVGVRKRGPVLRKASPPRPSHEAGSGKVERFQSAPPRTERDRTMPRIVPDLIAICAGVARSYRVGATLSGFAAAARGFGEFERQRYASF